MLDYIHVFLVSVRGRILERGDVTLFLSSHVSRMFVRFVWSAGDLGQQAETIISTTRRSPTKTSKIKETAGHDTEMTLDRKPK